MGTLFNSLPQFMAEQPVISHIIVALEGEIGRLGQRVADMQEELYITTSRQRIDRWERELRLACRTDLGQEQRSKAALIAFSQWDTCTAATIANIVARLVQVAAVVTELPDSGTVEVKVSKNTDIFCHLPMCFEAVKNALPAHIKCRMEAVNNIFGYAHFLNFSYGWGYIDIMG